MSTQRPNAPRYAARLNAFKACFPGEKPSTADLLRKVAEVPGLNAADLNYPDQITDANAAELGRCLDGLGISLNGLAMRYYTDPGFALGAFTHPDRAVRRKAIDLTKRGIDHCAALNAPLMTLWMGQDGFDYAFQMDYARAWDDTIAAMAEVADHNPDVDVAIEYKPNEPRAYALMPDIGTTLLATRDVDRPNIGVTLDFAHVLYADEMPAHTAMLIARHSRLMGVHLNDGYGKRDDGLMVGTVHPVATVELFCALDRIGYDGAIYFDTFPDHSGINPVAEASTNVEMAERLRAVAARLGNDPDLARAIEMQDAAASQRIVARALYAS
ncbi:Unknown pentose isomerase [Candidatus Rhodobacter oscarellae]|uniref:Xylose isomerase n=1 Tax=Candidatus Rhodobacter oscarellae TaxID=1675527 RepID=A0A0J9GZN1_9RHOB|nr:sugar phosphate isomerase/epimerase family protein [Candidatus Rhodobacter lobularis]KMW58938.1 Unknown pentose isomerase [Candidatus Rhodobacter lobularis]